MRQIRYLSGKKSQTPSGSYIKPLVQLAPALPDPRSAGPSATLRERPQRVEPDVDPLLQWIKNKTVRSEQAPALPDPRSAGPLGQRSGA